MSAVINLAHTLGQTAVAEGVETEGQLEMLDRLGCDFAQGYHWGGPPRPPDMLEELVADGSVSLGAVAVSRSGK